MLTFMYILFWVIVIRMNYFVYWYCQRIVILSIFESDSSLSDGISRLFSFSTFLLNWSKVSVQVLQELTLPQTGMNFFRNRNFILLCDFLIFSFWIVSLTNPFCRCSRKDTPFHIVTEWKTWVMPSILWRFGGRQYPHLMNCPAILTSVSNSYRVITTYTPSKYRIRHKFSESQGILLKIPRCRSNSHKIYIIDDVHGVW